MCWKFSVFLIVIAMFTACSHQVEEEVVLPEKIDFNFHVRPILSNNCFLCHGPDESSREADLRLDEEEFAKAIRDEGKRAIVSGHASNSELIKRITSDDPDFQMPPPKTNKKLTAQEIAILKKWIDEGAEWKPYWAFIPPESTSIPNKGKDHPVDNFISASLEMKGITSSPEADPTHLIRRLSYTLTGLPPDSEMIERFTTGTITYEELVEHYLASPQYGEHWARHWMDLARYAEGKGHEFDYPVIGAWFFFSPQEAGPLGIIWGIGPALLLPTGTDPLLSQGQVGLGPTFVALKQGNGWTGGFLMNHIFGLGDHPTKDTIDSTYVQPFLSYSQAGWTYSVNTELTYNWNDDQWTGPVNFQIAKLMMMGHQPVQLFGAVKYWALDADSTPHDFGARFGATFLFPN